MYTDSGHYQHGSVNSVSGSRNVGWLHNLSIALTATTQAKPNATGEKRNRALYQHNGDLTVLEETFGAAASKAPFLWEKGREVL